MGLSDGGELVGHQGTSICWYWSSDPPFCLHQSELYVEWILVNGHCLECDWEVLGMLRGTVAVRPGNYVTYGK